MTTHPIAQENFHPSQSADSPQKELAPNPAPSSANGDSAIAVRAYQRYLAGGKKDGHDVENWLQAEQELLAEQRRQPGAEHSVPKNTPSEVEFTDYVSLQ